LILLAILRKTKTPSRENKFLLTIPLRSPGAEAPAMIAGEYHL